MKSQYSPRNKVNMAMLLLINASRNVQFLFFYVTWTKFRVSFQSRNSHHRASQISMSFRNPKCMFQFVNIHSHPKNIYLLAQKDIFVIFSTFKKHFQFLTNKMSCLETFLFVGKNVNSVKEEYVIVTIISTSWKIKKKSINKVTYISIL